MVGLSGMGMEEGDKGEIEGRGELRNWVVYEGD